MLRPTRPNNVSEDTWNAVSRVDGSCIYWRGKCHSQKIGDCWWSRITDGGPTELGYTLSPDGQYIFVQGHTAEEYDLILKAFNGGV